MITGAVIGFLVWTVIFLLNIYVLKVTTIDSSKCIAWFVFFVGIGFSIGYLLS